MVDWLVWLNGEVNALLWGPPMLVLLIATGVYLTVRTRCIQFSKFGLMCRETMGKIVHRGPRADGDVTPFQALTVAMGGTVGVGNIAGVATAIALGGPGAVFWMLVSGLLGMATKFAEVVLGVHYRKREPGGPMMGGPMMYITRGLGRRWKPLAIVFCIFGAAAGLGIGNMTQANAVADGIETLVAPAITSPAAEGTESTAEDDETTAQRLRAVRWITGGVLLIAVGLVTIGGIKRIANVAMFCVPFMCIVYMLAALVIIAIYAGRIPEVVQLIFTRAFTPTAAGGGIAGSAIMLAMRHGIARGVFSNEAGLGSAPIAHATAQTDHPVRQGLWGIFEVFVDTIVMCSMTALVILLTGAWTGGEDGAKLTIAAFSVPLGGTWGSVLVTLCMILTAYDTILAWCFYGETCCAFVFGHRRIVRMIYRLLWLPFILFGTLGGLRTIWAVSDTLNGLMAIPNLIALLALGGVVVALTKGFLAGKPYEPPEPDAPPLPE